MNVMISTHCSFCGQPYGTAGEVGHWCIQKHNALNPGTPPQWAYRQWSEDDIRRIVREELKRGADG